MSDDGKDNRAAESGGSSAGLGDHDLRPRTGRRVKGSDASDFSERRRDALRSEHRSVKRRSRLVGFSILGFVIVILAAVAWVGVRGLLAKGELEAAIPLATSVQSELGAGDAAAARDTAQQLKDHAAEAARLTNDPVWRAAELFPFAGPNLVAFREAAAVTDSVASEAVWPLANNIASFGIDTFRPVNGAVDLAPIVSVEKSVQDAAAVLSAASARAESIDTASTIGPIQDAVGQLQVATRGADQLMSGVSNAVVLLPRMLGADGPRNYLLVFQNPAEVRAGGGVTSALALIRTDHGAVNLIRQESSGAFGTFDPPALQLPSETRGLYGERPAQYVQNTTLVPQFELSGQIAAAMWKERFGDEVDGVMAFDPVALGYLLKSTGSITLPTGEELTSENAVSFLLSDVYAKYVDPSIQDAVFASAARSVFDRVSSGGVQPRELLSALVRAGDEGRLRLWSAHEEDQAILGNTSLSGPLPMITPNSTEIGVYLNDGTGAKMDYYLRTEVSTGSELCRADGRPAFRVTLTLTNTVTADMVGRLPDYVSGNGGYGVTPGNVKTVVYIYGPESNGPLTDAAILTNLDVGMAGAQSSASFDSNHTVAVVPVELGPGESRTLTADFLGQLGNPLRLKPLVTPMIIPTVYANEIKSGFSGC